MMAYEAKQGDIVWVNLDPRLGHEQKGRCPALVVSNNDFNAFMRTMAMLCPITNTDKSLPIHVRLEGKTETTGVILCDQAKILDVRMREAQFIEKAPLDVVYEVVDIISGFIEVLDE